MTLHESPQTRVTTKGVSAVVVQYGPPDLVLELVDSLSRHADAGIFVELIIVDNDGGLEQSIRDRIRDTAPMTAHFVETAGTSYSAGVNAGVAAAQGEFLCVMNNDLVWEDGLSVEPLLDAMAADDVGIAGPQLLNTDGTWQRSYGSFPSVAAAVESILFIDTLRNVMAARTVDQHRSNSARPVDYVDGALMCIRSSCFAETGGLDESMPFYGEDTDLCRRATQLGWTIAFVPGAEITHVRGATSTREDPGEFERKLFASKVRFVDRNVGSSSARRYAHLLKTALALRARLYPLIAAVGRSETSQARAAAARTRYAAVRDIR